MASRSALGRTRGLRPARLATLARPGKVLDELSDLHVAADVEGRLRRNLDQDVDAALRPILAARDRTEQGGMSHALRPQCGLSLLQRSEYGTPVHRPTLSNLIRASP